MRMDYYRKYQEIIADYNREKDRVTVEETFAKLVDLANSLDAEQRRAAEEPAVRRLGRGQRGSFRRSDLRRCFGAQGARPRTGPSAMLAQGSGTAGPPLSGRRASGWVPGRTSRSQ